MMNLPLMMKGGSTAAVGIVALSADTMLSIVADIFGEIVAHYKASSTPYRAARVKKYEDDKYFGFSAKECVDAVLAELKASDASDLSVVQYNALRRVAKKAVWRVANLAEAQYLFDLFKNRTNEALKHIRKQFEVEHKRIAKRVLEHNGYDLTVDDYVCTLWLHLYDRGSWKSFNSYRGDSSIYAWLKEVGRHCINRYVEECGFCALTTPKRDDEDDDDEAQGALNAQGGKRIVYFEDYSWTKVADSRGTYDYDYVTDDPNFLLDRIAEMHWEDWEKDFMVDSVINEMSALDLTEKYGAMAALLQGENVPFDRRWTDNRNSRMKRDLYAYALAYMHDDKDVLKAYAKKRAVKAARSVVRAAA